jgi:hypothetical protein
MKSFALTAFAAMMLLSISVQADDFHPSRARLLLHSEYQVNDEARVRVNFIPAGNLLTEIAPLAYLGLGWQATEWLDIEGTIGWCFRGSEPIFSLRLSTNADDFYSWGDIELQLPSENAYWFLMVEYKLLDWIHLGIEGEGWGNCIDNTPWSNGGGPNLIFQFGRVGLDLALHVRDLNDSVKPEFFGRVHLFL